MTPRRILIDAEHSIGGGNLSIREGRRARDTEFGATARAVGHRQQVVARGLHTTHAFLILGSGRCGDGEF